MELSQKIGLARKKKGLTQEELAALANVTVRTIQRIESGETAPRAFTMKALADVLDIQFEDLAVEKENENVIPLTASLSVYDPDEEKHFLKTVCLSCFSYLVIPLVHFFAPLFLLNKSRNHHFETIAFGRKIIKQQIYWVVILCLLLMFTLAYNFIIAIYFNKKYLLHYLIPFFIMYFLNAFIILKKLSEINRR